MASIFVCWQEQYFYQKVLQKVHDRPERVERGETRPSTQGSLPPSLVEALRRQGSDLFHLSGVGERLLGQTLGGPLCGAGLLTRDFQSNW